VQVGGVAIAHAVVLDAVAEGLSASVNDGVLTVTIPRASSEECVWVPGEEGLRAGCHA